MERPMIWDIFVNLMFFVFFAVSGPVHDYVDLDTSSDTSSMSYTRKY